MRFLPTSTPKFTDNSLTERHDTLITNVKLTRRRYASAEGSTDKPLHTGNRLWKGPIGESWIRMDCGVDVRSSLTSHSKDGIELLGYCRRCFGKKAQKSETAKILEFPDVEIAGEAAG